VLPCIAPLPRLWSPWSAGRVRGLGWPFRPCCPLALSFSSLGPVVALSCGVPVSCCLLSSFGFPAASAADVGSSRLPRCLASFARSLGARAPLSALFAAFWCLLFFLLRPRALRAFLRAAFPSPGLCLLQVLPSASPVPRCGPGSCVPLWSRCCALPPASPDSSLGPPPRVLCPPRGVGRAVAFRPPACPPTGFRWWVPLLPHLVLRPLPLDLPALRASRSRRWPSAVALVPFVGSTWPFGLRSFYCDRRHTHLVACCCFFLSTWGVRISMSHVPHWVPRVFCCSTPFSSMTGALGCGPATARFWAFGPLDLLGGCCLDRRVACVHSVRRASWLLGESSASVQAPWSAGSPAASFLRILPDLSDSFGSAPTPPVLLAVSSRTRSLGLSHLFLTPGTHGVIHSLPSFPRSSRVAFHRCFWISPLRSRPSASPPPAMAAAPLWQAGVPFSAGRLVSVWVRWWMLGPLFRRQAALLGHFPF